MLKVLACFCMLVDHVCGILFHTSYTAYLIRYSIGRLAFPLFAFMLCEGFFHTRNKSKYLLNLLITAVVSECFYDLGFDGQLFYPGKQNTIFTLLLSLIMLMIMEQFRDKFFIQIIIAAAFSAAAHYLRVDYGLWGVAAVAIYYFMYFAPYYISGFCACIPIICGFQTYSVLLVSIPLAFYNGKQGTKNNLIKYGFYLFYPVHLIVLVLIKHFVLHQI